MSDEKKQDGYQVTVNLGQAVIRRPVLAVETDDSVTYYYDEPLAELTRTSQEAGLYDDRKPEGCE